VTVPSIEGGNVRKLVVACDAGMGSSVMLASTLRGQLKKQNVSVEHTPVGSIPDDADVVVVHEGLADRARGVVPDKPIIAFKVFIGDPAVTKVVDAVKNGGRIDG
jgi:mannitol-specific phosphotransferase system IIBC component